MKKFLFVLLCLSALLLVGCGKQEEQQTEATDTPAPTVAETATPAPTATPEPIPTVAVSDYEYATVRNTNLQVSFMYPAHWVNDPGKSTICYVEPVSEGNAGGRLAVAAKSVSRAPDTKSLKEQLAAFTEVLAASYFTFTASDDINTDEAVFGTKGISQTYVARDEYNNRITGYILMAYVSSTKRIYVLNFSAPSNSYDQMSNVLATVRQSLSIVG